MSKSNELSEGSLEEYVCQGKHPPKNENIFQVLATKPVEVQGNNTLNSQARRFRAIISDGKHHFDFAMFLLFDNIQTGPPEVPEDNSIIKIVNPDEALQSHDNFRQNSIKQMNGKLIWIICRFDILRKGGEKIGGTMKIQPKQTMISEIETTPQQNKTDSSGLKRQPFTPAKRQDRSEEPGVDSVKRALFSNPSTSKPHPLANSSLYKPSHKIKDLNPYQNKFRIKARVMKKSQLKQWSNSRGEGKVFDVILQDSSGDIKATAFNDVAVKFEALFEENKVYMVESAQIKPVQNRTYNPTEHNYELNLNQSTKIQEVADVASRDVPTTLYTFSSISDISSKPEKDKVDVLGVILEVRDIQDLTTRAGRQTKKREIKITDTSNCTINVTLWGDKAEHFPPEERMRHIIAIKGAEVSEWQGKSLNLGFNATFEIDPQLCKEAEILRNWYDNEGNNESTQSLTNKSFSIPNVGSELISLTEVKQSFQSNNIADSVKYFTVEASIITIKAENIMYRACPSESCRRKVVEEPPNSGEYKCSKCDKKFPNFTWRYSIQAAIADFSDFHWVTIFEESASAILGMSADDLSWKKEENMIEYEKILESCKYVPFQLTLKSKVESWNDEKRLRLSIVKAEKVDRSSGDRLSRLKDDIQRLKLILR